MNDVKLIAFDLDGTLTQHKTKLGDTNRAVLDALRRKYKLLMVGAGSAMRIFNQLDHYPIDVIGNYGLQQGVYDHTTGTLNMIRNVEIPCDHESVEKRITQLRDQLGFTDFVGENVEFHTSGCVTFPILGTAALQEDKLRFDPNRKIRRKHLQTVIDTFPEFTVFVGGSSSYDMAPKPYNKYHALDEYCHEHGFLHSEVVYVGDDNGPGGNDESVYLSDFSFIPIDDHSKLGEKLNYLI